MLETQGQSRWGEGLQGWPHWLGSCGQDGPSRGSAVVEEMVQPCMEGKKKKRKKDRKRERIIWIIGFVSVGSSFIGN